MTRSTPTTPPRPPAGDPLTTRRFRLAAAAVALLVLGGVAVTVVNLTQDGDHDPTPAAASTAVATPSTPTSPGAAEDGTSKSICGLEGVEMLGTVVAAPQTKWEYQDLIAYPVSDDDGPAQVADEGYRYCFSQTPNGALFASANFDAMLFDSDLTAAWLSYGTFPIEEPDESTAGSSDPLDGRVAVEGFRVMDYAGSTARVDIAWSIKAGSQTTYFSNVHELAWEGGDWKLDTSRGDPIRSYQLPDISGYTPWTGE